MTCRTPGAVYFVKVTDTEVAVCVSLPFHLELSEEEAKHLETRLHDAAEGELAQYFT